MGAGVGGIGDQNIKGAGFRATEAAGKIVDAKAIKKGKVAKKIAEFEARANTSTLPDAKKVGGDLGSPKKTQPGSKPIEVQTHPGVTNPGPTLQKAFAAAQLPLPLILEDDTVTEAPPGFEKDLKPESKQPTEAYKKFGEAHEKLAWGFERTTFKLEENLKECVKFAKLSAGESKHQLIDILADQMKEDITKIEKGKTNPNLFKEGRQEFREGMELLKHYAIPSLDLGKLSEAKIEEAPLAPRGEKKETPVRPRSESTPTPIAIKPPQRGRSESAPASSKPGTDAKVEIPSEAPLSKVAFKSKLSIEKQRQYYEKKLGEKISKIEKTLTSDQINMVKRYNEIKNELAQIEHRGKDDPVFEAVEIVPLKIALENIERNFKFVKSSEFRQLSSLYSLKDQVAKPGEFKQGSFGFTKLLEEGMNAGVDLSKLIKGG